MQNTQNSISNPAAISTLKQNLLATNILIFKTNIQTLTDQAFVKRYLDKNPFITHWNIDLEDVDCVLRIVCRYLHQNDIVELITKCGYYCEELE